MGQDPAIARASATYLETLIPGLFFYAWNVVLQAYMQSQGITKPGAVAGVVAALDALATRFMFEMVREGVDRHGARGDRNKLKTS